eukprot:2968259-Amphidinium_carterae.1
MVGIVLLVLASGNFLPTVPFNHDRVHKSMHTSGHLTKHPEESFTEESIENSVGNFKMISEK